MLCVLQIDTLLIDGKQLNENNRADLRKRYVKMLEHYYYGKINAILYNITFVLKYDTLSKYVE